jgi:tRNA U34 5-carboxymethylaminomethyl modifying GTPase MnmE/TrmE
VAQALGAPPVVVSARTGEGIPALQERILTTALPGTMELADAVIFTRRQQACVEQALDVVRRAMAGRAASAGELRRAAAQLRGACAPTAMTRSDPLAR